MKLSETDQLDAMRSIVKGEDTLLSRQYGGLSANNQLLVWYGWAREIGQYRSGFALPITRLLQR